MKPLPYSGNVEFILNYNMIMLVVEYNIITNRFVLCRFLLIMIYNLYFEEHY